MHPQVTLTSSGPHLHCPYEDGRVQVWICDLSSHLPCASQKVLPKSAPAAKFCPTTGPFSFGSFLLLCSQCFIAIQSKMLLHSASGCLGAMPGSRPHPFFWGSELEGTRREKSLSTGTWLQISSIQSEMEVSFLSNISAFYWSPVFNLSGLFRAKTIFQQQVEKEEQQPMPVPLN